MKRKLILIWLLCVAAAWCAQAAPPPSFKHLKDYMVRNHCEPFAEDALRLLHKRGVPARRILYRWSSGGYTDLHAAVLFQWEGRTYFMDNARMKPRHVVGKTDLGCVNRITDDFYTHCWMVDDYGKRTAPRKISDLFAPAPEWMRQLQESQRQ